MKKILAILILSTILVLPNLTFAIPVFPTVSTGSVELNNILKGIMTVMWYISVTVVIVMIIFTGIIFLTAAGDPAKIQTAKKAALWSVVGITLLLLAFVIVAIVQDVFQL